MGTEKMVQSHTEQASAPSSQATPVSRETLSAACQRIDTLEHILRECLLTLEYHAEHVAGTPNDEMRLLTLIQKALR